ncbi:hypothetical protein ACOWL4_07625, partial [Helicobacter pylori]
SVSYLAKAEFEFKSGVYDLVALPTGAEVVKVSLEVAGFFTGGSIHVGFKDEPAKDYFFALESLTSNGEREYLAKTFTSAADYTATSNKVVVAEVEHAEKMHNIKCVLRVVYFLPSVIEVEY